MIFFASSGICISGEVMIDKVGSLVGVGGMVGLSVSVTVGIKVVLGVSVKVEVAVGLGVFVSGEIVLEGVGVSEGRLVGLTSGFCLIPSLVGVGGGGGETLSVGEREQPEAARLKRVHAAALKKVRLSIFLSGLAMTKV